MQNKHISPGHSNSYCGFLVSTTIHFYGWQNLLLLTKVLEAIFWQPLPARVWAYQSQGTLPWSWCIWQADCASCSRVALCTLYRCGHPGKLISRPHLPIKNDGSVNYVPNSITINIKKTNPSPRAIFIVSCFLMSTDTTSYNHLHIEKMMS